MVVEPAIQSQTSGYLGLRMTADEFLALPESPRRYELVDGVVVMSPSASAWHQDVVVELVYQMKQFLETHPAGRVLPDMDVKLGEDLVYRPDLVFLSSAKAARVRDRITETPDLVVEVVSPESRSYDSQTKRDDYEAAGIAEYWLIDPERRSMLFFVLRDDAGRRMYREVPPAGERYASAVLAGFQLDLQRIQRLF